MRVKMRELEIEKRVRSFQEVALGYNEEECLKEAERCLDCKKPSCVEGCPVEIDIPAFISKIKERKFEDALRIIKEKNNLPAICGRVCPQEVQCERYCRLSKKGEGIAIGALERFVADWGIKNLPEVIEVKEKKGIRVCVVGSGPAGLTCGADLARLGYDVTIYEALHMPGGVLRYGIPPFRLPREILDYELDYVRKLGCKIICDVLIGRTFSIKELLQEFEAIFIASGAGLPIFPKIPGINLCRVYSANEFLTRINLMQAYRFPNYHTPINIGKKVAVIGGGNTAMDAARCSLRLGVEEVKIVYRRTELEMPARRPEIIHAAEEGVKFTFLAQPIRFIGDSDGFVKGIECLRCELGEPDESGRRHPIPIKNSNFIIEADTVILAIGLNPNPLIPSLTPELKRDKNGNLIIDERMRTTMDRIYAGGDIVGGEGTVIEAMGMGKKAAYSINEYLTGTSGGHRYYSR